MMPRHSDGLPVPTLQDVFAAERLIRPFLPETPVISPPSLAEQMQASVYIKCEHLQPIGAFKVRGGINLVGTEMGVSPGSTFVAARSGSPAGFVSASTGNHGQSIAYASRLFGVPAKIFVPENPNPLKAEAIRRLGAEVIEAGQDFDQARQEAEAFAGESGFRFVHPVREPLLLAGVATHTLELLRRVPDLEVLFVPVGAGSGACGAAIVAKSVNPAICVVAVQAKAAHAAYETWRSGRLVEDAPMATVAEGLATRVAFEYPAVILRALLDDFMLVSDEEMAAAIRMLLFDARQVAEEAGAASLAGALKRPDLVRGRKVGLILSGGNLAPHRLREIASQG